MRMIFEYTVIDGEPVDNEQRARSRCSDKLLRLMDSFGMNDELLPEPLLPGMEFADIDGDTLRFIGWED